MTSHNIVCRIMASNNDLKCLSLNRAIYNNQHTFWRYISNPNKYIKKASIGRQIEVVRLLLPIVGTKDIEFYIKLALLDAEPPQIDIAKLLIASVKTDLNIDLSYIFNIACRDDFIEIVKILLHNYRIQNSSFVRSKGLTTSCENGNPKIVEILLRDQQYKSSLINSCLRHVVQDL